MNAKQLAKTVTIAVSPRERHYSLLPSLLSIFATVPRGVRVIVAQGDLPPDLRESLADLQKIRNFDLIAPDYPLYPQEARNLCVQQVKTDFVVITDNDLEYEPGWLEAFAQNAVNLNSDIVAPVIFIGPPRAKTIHHAGGVLHGKVAADGSLMVKEFHRLANKDISEVDVNALGNGSHTGEFHCFLARVNYLRKSGRFDERFITQEQVEFGLRIRALEGHSSFAPGVKVTYMAKKAFTTRDLDYLSFRWNDDQAAQSMEGIRQSWGISFDVQRQIAAWIRPHRVRAYGTRYQEQLKSMGIQLFFSDFMRPLERAALERAMKLRNGKQLAPASLLPDELKTRALQAFLMPS